MTIEWQDRFNIGNQQIDHQHQQLFVIANHFLTATTKEDQLRCAENLFEYTRNHFSYEESLMKKFNFPEVEQHIRSHHALLSRLEALNSTILADSLDANELQAFIQHWALFHIPTADAKLAEYMCDSQTRQVGIE